MLLVLRPRRRLCPGGDGEYFIYNTLRTNTRIVMQQQVFIYHKPFFRLKKIHFVDVLAVLKF